MPKLNHIDSFYSILDFAVCSCWITLLISLLLMWETVMICLYPCVYIRSHNFLRISPLIFHPSTAMCTCDDSCPCATTLNRQYFFKEQLFLHCTVLFLIVYKYQPESGILKEMIFYTLDDIHCFKIIIFMLTVQCVLLLIAIKSLLQGTKEK